LTRRDWWIGIALLVAALLVHAALPRYEWRDTLGGRQAVRIDRWTGGAVWGTFPDEVPGRWMSVPDIMAMRAAKNATDAHTKAAAAPEGDAIATKLSLTPVAPSLPPTGRGMAAFRAAQSPAAPDQSSSPLPRTGDQTASLSDVAGVELPPTQPGRASISDVLGTPICDSKALLRPATGSELGGKYRGGLGQLKIANGTQRDAVAVLIDSATKVPKRAIFVRSGEAGAITSVPSGNYRLRFQFGQQWLRERRFCEPANTSEFDDAFDFHQLATVGGTKYSTFEVTLHPVVDGTAKTHSPSNAELRLPVADGGPDDFEEIVRKYGGTIAK
jgi:hypothetical protein